MRFVLFFLKSLQTRHFHAFFPCFSARDTVQYNGTVFHIVEFAKTQEGCLWKMFMAACRVWRVFFR